MSHAQEISLSELNNLVKNAIQICFPDYYWIRAELSEVRESYQGHCYVEFVEKSERNNQIVAKAKGTIWANRWRELKPYFESITQQTFSAGIKVMVQVTIQFHELYGYSLQVIDLDPSYTLGDMMRNRAEILQRLQEEGVKDLNKELILSSVVRRIAVVSSATAAGYGDFMKQLAHNEGGYHFYTHLFPAVMQGSQTEKSILLALDKIHQQADLFDVVVIIRGGGATSELQSFDSYLLAAHVAQFPIPVLTGIGHDRDETVLDMVAYQSLKTPTAVASFLVSRLEQAHALVQTLEGELFFQLQQRMELEKQKLARLSLTIPQSVQNLVVYQQGFVRLLEQKLHLALSNKTQSASQHIAHLAQSLRLALQHRLAQEQQQLTHFTQVVELVNPARLLEKGYSLTLCNGEVLTSSRQFHRGDRIQTLLADGAVESIVTDITYK